MRDRIVAIATALVVAASAMISAQGAGAQDDGWTPDLAAASDETVHPGGEVTASVADAALTPPVVNGDFETGNLAGWTAINGDLDPEAEYPVSLYTGAVSCPTGIPGLLVLPAPTGTFGACFAQDQVTRHILYQDLALSGNDLCVARFDHWYFNNFTDWLPGPLDLTDSVQMYRVDVVDPAAAVDSTAPGDVLVPVFVPQPGDPLTPGADFVSVEVDLSQFRGQTVRLRFLQANTSQLQSVAIDNVTLECMELQSRIFVSNRLASGLAQSSFLFGTPTSAIVTGDWDGSGADGFGSRLGNLVTLADAVGNPIQTVAYGKASDTMLAGDWNADGTATLAVRRGNVYYLKNTIAPGEADIVFGFGTADDEVFVGDFNGNGQDTFAVRRGNVFYVRNSLTSGVADVVFAFGQAGDDVLVGDFDGDGTDSFAVRRGNLIFISNDFQPGPAESVIGFGRPSDHFLVGDFDGDGVDTFAVRRLELK